MIHNRCYQLRQRLRFRPTLPMKANGDCLQVRDLDLGIRIPLYSCPFKTENGCACNFHTSDRTLFIHHVAGGVADETHRQEIENICTPPISWMSNLDYVHGAIAIAERERWPRLGLATTRRALSLLCERYNDETTKCVACFICGQLRTTCEGYPQVDLQTSPKKIAAKQTEISYKSPDAFREVEKKHPGTLLNNCSYHLWKLRYRDRDRSTVSTYPWSLTEPLSKPLSQCDGDRCRHISRCALDIKYMDSSSVLFGDRDAFVGGLWSC